MKPVRDITVKTLFNADEYIAFSAACAAADTSHSKALRDLARDWTNRQRNDRRSRAKQEWPSAGQNQAMFFPSRGYSPAKMRIQV